MSQQGKSRPRRTRRPDVRGQSHLNPVCAHIHPLQVTIHQSLCPHSNIVTLYRSFETPAFLLLLLEYVPGEDLFYFLEQARDHYEPAPVASEDATSSPSRTPPTPSLLASLHPSQLLSPTRLRLIARMFSQMCDAVASCHDQGVFHRDIKPENFIVTDGFANGERRVVVKLTDFGLSTTDAECSDMDCGSAPYMSFECRNNCAPTYRPAPADVWSLGIVLINMYVLSPSRYASLTLFQVVPLQPLDGHRPRGLFLFQSLPSAWFQLLYAAFHRYDACRG